MTIAIHYSPVRQPPKPGQIYGIQVAILDWLRAWMRYSRQEKLTFLISDQSAQKEIMDIARECGVDPSRLVLLDGRLARENLPTIQTVFRADPDPCHLFWQRRYAGASFSFCGLAHAVSGIETAKVLEQYMLAGATEKDAIICPSRAVASAVGRYWDHLAAFYEQRFGKIESCPVQCPVLPLGVERARITSRVSPEKRAVQRAALQIENEAIVLLWIGRMSYAIKGHPLPMFRAAQEAAKRTGKKVHLVMQGYFVPEESKAEFESLAAAVCTVVQVHFIAADDARFPDGLWAAGDIFLSLVDNMQESFGLTPIEAIAAGLPRVVSDWDGYRDSVSHGVDGFLVPTMQPPSGAGEELAASLLGGRESYGGYLALTSQSVGVDAMAAAAALIVLIEQPELRTQIAAKAKERLSHYDWSRLIPAYEELWQNLPLCEASPVREVQRPLSLIHPQTPDPFFMFQDYPAHVLCAEDRVCLALPADEFKALLHHGMNTLAVRYMVGSDDLASLLYFVAEKQTPLLADIFAAFPVLDRASLWRTIGWLLKLGALRLV